MCVVMNKVKHAIIMAAGMGKRLRPLTLDVPKPLIPINGKTMIDTIIQGLHANKIEEIYIVVGYLKEQFFTRNRQKGRRETCLYPFKIGNCQTSCEK